MIHRKVKVVVVVEKQRKGRGFYEKHMESHEKVRESISGKSGKGERKILWHGKIGLL